MAPGATVARHQRSISARRAARTLGTRTSWRGILTATTGYRRFVGELRAPDAAPPRICSSMASADVPGIRSPMARIWSRLAVNRPKKIPEYRSSTRSATRTAEGGRQPMSQNAPRMARSSGWFHRVQHSGVGTPGNASAVLTVVQRVVGPLSWCRGSNIMRRS
jgi:hypothetical protein